MRILIAEDDLVSRKILTEMLEKESHEVIATNDGAQAWEEAQKPGAPSLVFLDLMMPKMNGLKVCRLIREHQKKQGHYVYIVLQTARDSAADVENGFAAGVDDYLVKPLAKADLLHRLSAAERILSYEAERVETNNKLAQYANEMKQLAEERAGQLVYADRMAMLGTLSAGIAHEINNPTSFIAGNIQTMGKAWVQITGRMAEAGIDSNNDQQISFILEEFPKMMAGISNGVERITKIVNGLKSYVHQKEGAMDSFDLKSTIETSLELCNNILKYGTTVEVDLPTSIPPLFGDSSQIEQVLINLITNSVHAMENQKTRYLEFLVKDAGEKAVVKVRDNGPGLSKEVLKRLFDPFFTTKKQGKGTGLGLSISKRIIEDHKGELMVRNHPDGGCEFTIELPYTLEPVKQGENS